MRTRLPALFLLGFCSIAAQAQTLKTNLLVPVSLAYEQPLTTRSSVQGSLSYALFVPYYRANSVDINNPNAKHNSVSANLEYRYYLSSKKAAHTGLYAGAFAKYHRFQDHFPVDARGQWTFRDQNDPTEGHVEIALHKFGFGVLAGLQGQLNDRFYFDAFVGFGFPVYAILNQSPEPVGNQYAYGPLDFAEYLSRLGFSLGYRFQPKAK